MDELKRRRLRRRITAFQQDQADEAASWGEHGLAHQVQVAIINNCALTCSELLDAYDERHAQLMRYRTSNNRSGFGPIRFQTEQAIMNGDSAALQKMYKLQRIAPT